MTSTAWAGGYVSAPAAWFSAPDFSSVFLKLDVVGALHIAVLPAIITVMLTDLFDSLSTFIGVAHAANLIDERCEPKNPRQGLMVGGDGAVLPALSVHRAGSSRRSRLCDVRGAVLVGVSMFQAVSAVPFERVEIGVPAFATLILIPLTFSITQGILWGFILHAVLHAAVGRAREVSAAAWGLAAVSVLLLVIEHAY